jgi:hypothetical protein
VARNRLIDSSERSPRLKGDRFILCTSSLTHFYFSLLTIVLPVCPFLILDTHGTLLHFERLHFVLVCLEKKRNKKSIEFLEMKKKKDVDALPVLLSCF